MTFTGLFALEELYKSRGLATRRGDDLTITDASDSWRPISSAISPVGPLPDCLRYNSCT